MTWEQGPVIYVDTDPESDTYGDLFYLAGGTVKTIVACTQLELEDHCKQTGALFWAFYSHINDPGGVPDPDPAYKPADWGWTGAEADWAKAAVALRTFVAKMANSVSAGICAYMKANVAVSVSITPSDSGLQRLPASLVENEPTKAPSLTKTISGSIT